MRFFQIITKPWSKRDTLLRGPSSSFLTVKTTSIEVLFLCWTLLSNNHCNATLTRDDRMTIVFIKFTELTTWLLFKYPFITNLRNARKRPQTLSPTSNSSTMSLKQVSREIRVPKIGATGSSSANEPSPSADGHTHHPAAGLARESRPPVTRPASGPAGRIAELAPSMCGPSEAI